MFLNNEKYSPDTLNVARQVANDVYNRHLKWLASARYIIDYKPIESIFNLFESDTTDFALIDHEKQTRYQKVLDLCKKEKANEKYELEQNDQEIMDKIAPAIFQVAENMFVSKLKSNNINQLCALLPDFERLASVAYSPAVTISKLSDIATGDENLKLSLINLLSKPTFCEQINRVPKKVHDTKLAIGHLGLENSRVLLPLLMVSPILTCADQYTKPIMNKLWRNLIITANVNKILLKNTEKADVGILIGVLRNIAKCVIVNQFTSVYESALSKAMLYYRITNQKNEYYACAKLKPNIDLLPRVIHKTELGITEKLLAHFNWSRNTSYVKDAILDDIQKVPLKKRSKFGVALGQANAYSIYKDLHDSNAFLDKHKAYWFLNANISDDILTHIQDSSPDRLRLITTEGEKLIKLK